MAGAMGAPVWLPVAIVSLAAARTLPRMAVSALGLRADEEVLWRARRLDGPNATAPAGGEGPGAPTAAVWPGLVLAATLMKLTASTDDVVWLLPFLVGERKRRNVPFYLLCMQLVVGISWAFSAGGAAVLEELIGEGSAWPMSKILELISAVLLTLYTAKLLREWWLERQATGEEDERGEREKPAERPPGAEHDDVQGNGGTAGAISAADVEITELPDPSGGEHAVDEEGAPGRRSGSLGAARATGGLWLPWQCLLPCLRGAMLGASASAAPAAPVAPAAAAAAPAAAAGAEGAHSAEALPQREASTDDKLTMRRLFTISMFGSLDDFAVFVSLLLAQVFNAWQLSIGVLLGSLTVVTICLAAGRCDCVVRMVERIPLWCIIGAFAIWSYISTFALSDDH